MSPILAILALVIGIGLAIWGVFLIVGGSLIGGIAAIVIGLIIASAFGYHGYRGRHGGPVV